MNVGQHAMLVVSLKLACNAVQQLDSGEMTTRADIIDGTNVHVSIDANTGQQVIAWQPATDSVFWVYGTDIADDALFNIVRSLQITGADPEAITGDRIGYLVDHTQRFPGTEPDGTINLAEVPAWISVSSQGVVVGYMKKSDAFSSPRNLSDARPAEPIPVYDNNGTQIGVLEASGFVPNGG